MHIKQVIVMRKDLGMRKGKMISQGAHASMKIFFDRIKEFSQDVPNINDEHYYDRPRISKIKEMSISITPQMLDWITGKFTKICVSVNSEKELLDIFEKAKCSCLPCALIKDEGLTEFKEPTFTCCAIGPDLSERIDPITGSLPLL